MPYSTRVKNRKKILIPDLAKDGWNWSIYHEKLFYVAKHEGLIDHLLGMAQAPFMEDPGQEEWNAREIRAKQLLAITVPDDILKSLGPKTLFENGAHYFGSQLAYFIYSLTTIVDDYMCTQCAANDKVHTSDGVRNRSGTKWKGSPNKKKDRRVGKKGETPHRKVDEEIATATGPGTETTGHDQTDSVSLAILVSSPQLVKPTPPSPSRTNEPHGMGQAVVGRDDNDSDKY
jgi:hypothetical protein